MLGVILWSDHDDRKAVIWCEDQGDLAFLNAAESPLERDAFFDAGDVVQFDMDIDCSVRRAHNPRLVVEKVGKALPDALSNAGVPAAMPAGASAEVIPFAPRSSLTPRACSLRPMVSGG